MMKYVLTSLSDKWVSVLKPEKVIGQQFENDDSREPHIFCIEP